VSHADTRLFDAIASGDAETVLAVLVDGAALDARDGAGRSPLAAACAAERREIVRLLLWAGAMPADEDWLAAAEQGEPSIVLLLEKAAQRKALEWWQWLHVLARLVEQDPSAVDAAALRIDLLQVLGELPGRSFSSAAAEWAAGEAVGEGVRVLLRTRQPVHEAALVSVFARLLNGPGSAISEIGGTALYRLAGAGVDIAASLPSLVRGAPISRAAAAAITAYAARNEDSRHHVLGLLPPAADDGTTPIGRLHERLTCGDVVAPVVALTWETSARTTAKVAAWPDPQQLVWTSPGSSGTFSSYQRYVEFMTTHRPPPQWPHPPPPALVAELAEIVGPVLRNRQGWKQRFADHLRKRRLPTAACDLCAALGDDLYVDGEHDEKLPAAADRLRVLATNGMSLKSCRCGALFLLHSLSDNSDFWSSYRLQRIGLKEAIAFVGTDDEQPPRPVWEIT
jgi:hypothetical protein